MASEPNTLTKTKPNSSVKIHPKPTGLSKESIQMKIKDQQTKVLECFKTESKLNPKLEGKVVIGFDIGNDGEVLNSKINSTTLNHKKVEDCILAENKTWVFDKPTGKDLVHVNYPFVFSSTP